MNWYRYGILVSIVGCVSIFVYGSDLAYELRQSLIEKIAENSCPNIINSHEITSIDDLQKFLLLNDYQKLLEEFDQNYNPLTGYCSKVYDQYTFPIGLLVIAYYNGAGSVYKMDDPQTESPDVKKLFASTIGLFALLQTGSTLLHRQAVTDVERAFELSNKNAKQSPSFIYRDKCTYVLSSLHGKQPIKVAEDVVQAYMKMHPEKTEVV